MPFSYELNLFCPCLDPDTVAAPRSDGNIRIEHISSAYFVPANTFDLDIFPIFCSWRSFGGLRPTCLAGIWYGNLLTDQLALRCSVALLRNFQDAKWRRLLEVMVKTVWALESRALGRQI